MAKNNSQKRIFVMIFMALSGSVILMAQEKPPEKINAIFEDVTVAAGLAIQNGRGGHIAWGDYNNDGFEDLLVNGMLLFKNNGNGTFTNVTDKANITVSAQGGLWGDYDNDGYLDIFAYARQKYILWHNNKNGTFTEVTKEAGLSDNPYPTVAAAWLDIDNDGYLDIYVVNYEWNDKDKIGMGAPDVLFLNNKNGTFTDISPKAGIIEPGPENRKLCGYGAAPADYNNDGLMDIYVANYRLQPNFLWKNKGNGTFEDVTRAAAVQGRESTVRDDKNQTAKTYGHSIGAAWGDIDNDGDLDLFCANVAHPGVCLEYSDTSKLYINQGAPEWNFAEIREQAGIPYEERHSEPSFGDYDKDGFLDLYLSCCYKNHYALFYRNLGNLKFEDITKQVGINQEDGWGAGWCDYDNDGNLDLATGSGRNSTLKLYRNKGNKNSYLKVRVIGNHCNKYGIGARVKVTAGDSVQIREIAGAHGVGSQDSFIAFFGFGNYKNKVDIEVRFPCGKIKNLKAQPINNLITVRE